MPVGNSTKEATSYSASNGKVNNVMISDVPISMLAWDFMQILWIYPGLVSAST